MKESAAGKEHYFIRSGTVAWEQVGEGVERKVLGYDLQVMMVLVRFAKGAIGALHHHPHRQVTYIESGSFKVTINEKTEILNQGDSFFVAPDLAHGVVAIEAGCLIDVFTPAREDSISA